MSTQTTALTCNLTDDATFRTWCTAIDSAITNRGWVKTGEAGEMVPSTVLRPGTSANGGSIIYKMNDALQATAPCFLRIYYGCGATNTMYRFQFDVGMATDGANALTGTTTTLQTVAATAVVSSATNCYFSGTTSRFQMALFPAGSTTAFMFAIERDKDSTGADTANGIHVMAYCMNVITWYQQFLPPPAWGPAGAIEAKTCTLISSQTSQTSGSSTGVGVIRPVYGSLRYPSIGFLITSRGDWTTETTNTVSVYGTTRTYLALSTANILSATAVPNNATPGSMVLFE